MDQIILLTSCLSPIVEKDIANNVIEDNLKDLISNIKNILKKFNHEISNYKVVIADCSQNYFLKDEDIYPINKYLKDVKILNIKFSKKEIEQIKKKGKGFSELLLIKYAITHLHLKSSDIIHKITGRYFLLFPRKLIKYQSGSLNNYGMMISYSKIFKRTSCHFFTVKVYFLEKLIKELHHLLDDYNGNIIEKVLFKYIKKNKLIEKRILKRSYFFAYYSSQIIPGSSLARKDSSRYIFQIMRNIAFFF